MILWLGVGGSAEVRTEANAGPSHHFGGVMDKIEQELVWKRKFERLMMLLEDFKNEARNASVSLVDCDEFMTDSPVVYISNDLDVVDNEDAAKSLFGTKYKVFRLEE